MSRNAVFAELTIKSSTIKRRGYHINTSSFATKFVKLHEKLVQIGYKDFMANYLIMATLNAKVFKHHKKRKMVLTT